MEKQPCERFRMVAANVANGFGEAKMADPEHATAMLAYLGELAARDADGLFFSEAAAAGEPLSLDALAVFPSHEVVRIKNNDDDGRADRHDDVFLYKHDAVAGMHYEHVDGRTMLGVRLRIGQAAVASVLGHFFDRPKEARQRQGITIAARMKREDHALVAGDFNTIPMQTWQAKFLSNRLVRGFFRLLPASDPGKRDMITLPEVSGPLGSIVRAVAKMAARVPGVARFGSLGQRLTEMAEARGENGPLETLERDAGMTKIGGLRYITRSLFGKLGVQIDHGVQKGLRVLNFDVIPANGAADHDAIVFDLAPLGTDDDRAAAL